MNQMPLFDRFTPLAKTSFLAGIMGFKDYGKPTETYSEDGIPYFVNEFWTAGQRQAHSIHEISYRACFKAQLPEFFIERLSNAGDVVYDPFMGRGTTPVQAGLMGRHAFGNDVNPLSVLLTRPRLRPIEFNHVEKALRSVDWASGKIKREDLLALKKPQ